MRSAWGGLPDGVCSCVKTHTPKAQRVNAHHVTPQSWGGPTVASNLVDLCPTTHVNVHKLIDEYVHAKGRPAARVLISYNALTRTLAEAAWTTRPNDAPPLTSLPH